MTKQEGDSVTEQGSDDQGRPTSYADGSWPTHGVDVVDPVTNARSAWAYLRRAYGPPEPDGKAA